MFVNILDISRAERAQNPQNLGKTSLIPLDKPARLCYNASELHRRSGVLG